MNSIDHITLEAADPAAARAFYSAAFGLDDRIRFRPSDSPTGGFRGFTVSLVVAQPADVDALVEAALAAGAAALKPVAKSFWGYGGVVQAPDGSIWKAASSSKKNTAPASKRVEEVTLLLGAEDVAASKRFYVEHGLTVAKSYGKKYVQFDAGGGRITLGLYGRRALAKDAGVPPEGSGSHRMTIGGLGGPATDPDGFAWESAEVSAG